VSGVSCLVVAQFLLIRRGTCRGGGVCEWGRVVGQCFFCVARIDVDTSATLEQERVAQIYFKIYL
jgi:hypothetical protein